MATKEQYEAMTLIDKISSMRKSGYSESEIAEIVGKEISDKKISVGELRDLVAEKKRIARDAKVEQVKELMASGYSLKEAGEKLNLNYAEARSLALEDYLNKGEN